MGTGPGHDRWADTAGAYVLGALPEDERTGFEAHVTTCEACRIEVDQLAGAADALPVSAPAMVPPPALKARIMTEVNREAALLAAAGAGADRAAVTKPARRERRRWFGLQSVALACATLLAGIGVGAAVFAGGGGKTLQVAATGAAAKAVAEVDVSGDKAVLVAHNMPGPGQGKTYQVWLKRPGQAPQPTSALFTPLSDGSATATVTGDLHDGDQILVTAEPDGGSPMPTSDPVLAAQMT
jgi:anti-sigma-K factor RskA